MLTDDENAAIERWRLFEANDDDVQIIGDAMSRLFPPGWDAPVTPEGLIGLGGNEIERVVEIRTVEFPSGHSVIWCGECVDAIDVGTKDCVWLPEYMFPRNMKEARELLVRCGAIKDENQ